MILTRLFERTVYQSHRVSKLLSLNPDGNTVFMGSVRLKSRLVAVAPHLNNLPGTIDLDTQIFKVLKAGESPAAGFHNEDKIKKCL